MGKIRDELIDACGLPAGTTINPRPLADVPCNVWLFRARMCLLCCSGGVDVGFCVVWGFCCRFGFSVVSALIR